MLLLTMFTALVLRRKKFPGPVRVALVVVVALGIPALVSMLRELSAFTWDGLVENYSNVLDRAFGRVIEDGIWHVNHVQRHGFFGWQGIGNLAGLLGYEPVNVFNVVGFKHMPGLASASANTAFPIAYYSCFGLLSLPFSLLLLMVADALVLLWARLAPPMLIPCVAVSLVASISLVSTFFTTVLFTFGLGVIPFVAMALQRLFVAPSGISIHWPPLLSRSRKAW